MLIKGQKVMYNDSVWVIEKYPHFPTLLDLQLKNPKVLLRKGKEKTVALEHLLSIVNEVKCSNRKWWPMLYEWILKNPGVQLTNGSGGTYEQLKEKYPDLPIYNSLNSTDGTWGMREAGLIEHPLGESRGWFVTDLHKSAVDFLLTTGAEKKFYEALTSDVKATELLKQCKDFDVLKPKKLRDYVLDLFKISADGVEGSGRLSGEVSHINDRANYRTFGITPDDSLGNVLLERIEVNRQREKGNITTSVETMSLLYIVNTKDVPIEIAALNGKSLLLPTHLPTNSGGEIEALIVYRTHVLLRNSMLKLRKDIINDV
jgi:hypothetical protein